MHTNHCEIISSGQYVIFQRKDYKKIHLLSEKTSSIFMGKDKIDIENILGERFGSTFKMVPRVGFNRHFNLQLCSPNKILTATFKDIGNGLDNRSICDDGTSQSLTSHNIEVLRDKGTAPKVIIKQLVENSKTFQIKTEFSQEKYIKKKEKKYFEFITINHPSIMFLAEILYSRDLPKSTGIRIDTLSQLTTTLNYQPDGSYLLVENGFNGIVAATLLNSLSEHGRLIHITPGNQNQKHAVLAMNFPSSLMSRLITVRLSTMLELISQTSTSKISLNIEEDLTNPEVNGLCIAQNSGVDNSEKYRSSNSLSSDENMNKNYSSAANDLRKRKHTNPDSTNSELVHKKPRWAIEAELAVEVILKKVDGLVIACKEFSTDILNNLLQFVLPSRPFIVYSLYQEPLVTLYLDLKKRHDVVYLRITETWLRPYQVLPERTHPAVTVSSSSGFLLSGIKVVNE